MEEVRLGNAVLVPDLMYGDETQEKNSRYMRHSPRHQMRILQLYEATTTPRAPPRPRLPPGPAPALPCRVPGPRVVKISIP